MLAGLVDRTGIVDDEVGSLPFVLGRPLAPLSCLPLFDRPAPGLFDATLADFRRCIDENNAIANARPAGLQHDSRIEKNAAIPRLLRSGDPPLNFPPNGRMRNGFQIFPRLLAFGFVPPDQPA